MQDFCIDEFWLWKPLSAIVQFLPDRESWTEQVLDSRRARRLLSARALDVPHGTIRSRLILDRD